MTQLDTDRTALLMMDFQSALLDFIPDADALVPRVARLKAIARDAAIRVIYVVVQFRDGYPEVSSRNKSFSQLRDRGLLRASEASSGVHPDLAVEDGDVVVVKRRVGAFSNTELAVLLQARDIDTLVLSGINTSGVVLTTTRVAADMDYRLAIVSDCVGDPDPEVHELLLTKVFPKQAAVLTTDELADQIA